MKVKAIDFGRVKMALAKLDQIAKDHPEMIKHDTSAKEWEAVLMDNIKDDKDGKKKTKYKDGMSLGVKFPNDMIKAIDAYSDKFYKATKVRMSRSQTIRHLVISALEEDYVTKKEVKE